VGPEEGTGEITNAHQIWGGGRGGRNVTEKDHLEDSAIGGMLIL
jgi:hypothetical protein